MFKGLTKGELLAEIGALAVVVGALIAVGITT